TPENLTQAPATAAKTSSGLAYVVLKPGTGAVHPFVTSKVMAHFTSWRSDGRIFETTVMTNHPALVSVASAPLGWREAITSMVPGEKARFWIPAALAFGEKPANRFNPPGDLVYEIELLSVQSWRRGGDVLRGLKQFLRRIFGSNPAEPP